MWAEALGHTLQITCVEESVGDFAKEPHAFPWNQLHLPAVRAATVGSTMDLTRTQQFAAVRAVEEIECDLHRVAPVRGIAGQKHLRDGSVSSSVRRMIWAWTKEPSTGP